MKGVDAGLPLLRFCYQLLVQCAFAPVSCVSLLHAVSPSTRPIVSAVIGAGLGAAVVYAGYQAKQKRDGAAVIDLYNYLVEVRVREHGLKE